MVVTSIAIAISAARAGGIVCSQLRVRHSTAEQVSPIHSRNSELPARSSQKLPCSDWRAIAKMIATSSEISTTASTAGDAQKSGRKNAGADVERSGAGAGIALAQRQWRPVSEPGVPGAASVLRFVSPAAANSASLRRNSVEMSSSP